MQAKITKATFKSFIKKNSNNLYIQCVSSFDGMQDCVTHIKSGDRVFKPLQKTTIDECRYDNAKRDYDMSREQLQDRVFNCENTLGFVGIWLVGNSRDRFTHYEDNHFIGIAVYNCCGSFIIAIPKQQIAV